MSQPPSLVWPRATLSGGDEDRPPGMARAGMGRP
jgi:hypothetical protein